MSVDDQLRKVAQSASANTVVPIVLLLLINGLFLSAMLAMSKQAQIGGLSAIAYGFWMSLGGGVLLGIAALVRRPSGPVGHQMRYWFYSGLLTVAAPQLLIFIAVGKVGAGLVGIAFALPSLTTWVISRMIGIEGHSLLRLLGTIIGAVGAVILLMPSAGALPPSSVPWMALALLAPVIIGAGNVYRRIAWPTGSRPIELAAGMLITAAAMFLLAGITFGVNLAFWSFEGVAPLVLTQMLFAAAQFLAYFALQKIAHPVIFSLMGQIALVFALVIGLVFLGETYSATALGAVAIMGVGLLLVVFGKPDAPARTIP